MEAKKFDNQKPPMSILPWDALKEVSKVMAFGAEKYGRDNWREGMDWTRLSSAMLRHVTSWIEGEDVDDETGLSHLAHAGCCVLFLLSYVIKNNGRDDRYIKHIDKT